MLVVAVGKKELAVDADNKESIVAISFDGKQPISVPKSWYVIAVAINKLAVDLVLEHVAQTHFVVGSTYDTDDSVSHGSKKNSNAQSHDENSASAINENSESATLNDKSL